MPYNPLRSEEHAMIDDPTPMKRRVKVDLADLASAFDETFSEARQYLDVDTGQVALVSDEINGLLQELYEEAASPEGIDATTLAAALERRKLPDWMKEAIREADQVEDGFGTRFLRVPRRESRDGYRDMEAFIGTVRDERLQRRLWRAIEGRGAFRYFRDVLDERPSERALARLSRYAPA